MHSRFSLAHKSGNVGIIANFVFPKTCSFLLYFYHIMLEKVKLGMSGLKNITTRLQMSLLQLMPDGTAKTKLEMLELLYCSKFVKTLLQICRMMQRNSPSLPKASWYGALQEGSGQEEPETITSSFSSPSFPTSTTGEGVPHHWTTFLWKN